MKRNSNDLAAPLIGLAAVFATLFTLGLAVVVPANLAPANPAPAAGDFPASVATASGGARAVAVEVAIVPARIEVIGVRRPPAA